MFDAKAIIDARLKSEPLLELVKDGNVELVCRKLEIQDISDAAKKTEAEAIIEQVERDLEKQKDETLLELVCRKLEIQDISDAAQKVEAKRDLEKQKNEALRIQALDADKGEWGRLWAAKDIKDELLKDETLLELVKDSKMNLETRKKALRALGDAAKKLEAEAILDQAAREIALDSSKDSYTRFQALEYITDEDRRENVLLSLAQDPNMGYLECSKAVLKIKDSTTRNQALLALVLRPNHSILMSPVQLLKEISDDTLLLNFLKGGGFFEYPKAIEFIKDPGLQQEAWYCLALASGAQVAQRQAAIENIQDLFKRAEACYALALDVSVNKDERLKAAKALVPWEGCSYNQETAIERMQDSVWTAIAMSQLFYFEDRCQAAGKILDISERDAAYCSLAKYCYEQKDNFSYDKGIAVASKIMDDSLRLEAYCPWVDRVTGSFTYKTKKHDHHLSDWITSADFPKDPAWYYAVARSIEGNLQWADVDRGSALTKYLIELNKMEGEAREEKFQELFNDTAITHNYCLRSIAEMYVKTKDKAEVDQLMDDIICIRSGEGRFKRTKPIYGSDE